MHHVNPHSPSRSYFDICWKIKRVLKKPNIPYIRKLMQMFGWFCHNSLPTLYKESVHLFYQTCQIISNLKALSQNIHCGELKLAQSSWRIFFKRYFHFLPFEIHINTTDVYNMSISHFIKIYVCVYIVCLPSYFRNPRQAFLTAGRIQLLSVSSLFKFLSFIFVSPFFINSSKFFSKKRSTSVFSFFDCYKWYTK